MNIQFEIDIQKSTITFRIIIMIKNMMQIRIQSRLKGFITNTTKMRIFNRKIKPLIIPKNPIIPIEFLIPLQIRQNSSIIKNHSFMIKINFQKKN